MALREGERLTNSARERERERETPFPQVEKSYITEYTANTRERDKKNPVLEYFLLLSPAYSGYHFLVLLFMFLLPPRQ